MTAFAGILRHDRTPVPEGWLQPFTARPSTHVFQSVSDASVCFATWPRGTEEPKAAAICPGPDGQILLLDSRIDNREELDTLLKRSDALLTGVADAELALQAWSRWGEDAPARLVGEFALALWDPGRRRLFLARDRLGTRAIYYSSSTTHFAFSTELRALLALPFVPRTLCEDTVADYLNGDGSGPPDATFYEAVRALPAAHALVLEGGRFRQKSYGSPEERTTVAPANADYAQELGRRITTAVECRLRGGKRVAVHLSGGLDSSAVACLAARRLRRENKRLLAICSLLPQGHQGPESDEREYIEAVLAQEDNIDPVWVRSPVGMDPFGALTRWFDMLAQPSYSNVTHIEEQLGEAGRAHGVDVVLSGFGGDLFASIPGQNTVRELLRAGRWGPALSTLRALHREQGTSWPRLLRREIPSLLALFGLRPGHSAGARAGSAHPDLLQRLDGRAKRVPMPSLNTCSPWESMRFVLAPGHIERVLSAYTQVFACEFAQELRFPLLDSRVIEWMLGMPAEQFQLGGWPRSLMRRAMANILPERIRLRRDKGGAFDPAITSRFVASRAGLIRWAEETCDRRCWRYVDRMRFLKALQAVEATPRAQWRQEFFRIVLSGGIIARFLEWHERGEESPCS